MGIHVHTCGPVYVCEGVTLYTCLQQYSVPMTSSELVNTIHSLVQPNPFS